jgi:hypothetical protein
MDGARIYEQAFNTLTVVRSSAAIPKSQALLTNRARARDSLGATRGRPQSAHAGIQAGATVPCPGSPNCA